MEFRFDPHDRRLRISARSSRLAGSRAALCPTTGFSSASRRNISCPTPRPSRCRPKHRTRCFKPADFGTSGRIEREFLQAQIEVATEPHCDAGEARRELLRLRQNAAGAAAEHGLAVLACGTHPHARWRDSVQSPKDRYAQVMDDLQMIGQRNMLCGMHVHVEFPDPSGAST